jgi:hypothetical protein
LYGWTVTLKEEHKLRASENRMQKREFRPREAVTETWRKLHNEGIHVLFFK